MRWSRGTSIGVPRCRQRPRSERRTIEMTDTDAGIRPAQVTDRAAWTPPGFTRRYVDADGVRLHCVCGGPPDGPRVVLLHGWPQTWHFALHQQRDIAEMLVTGREREYLRSFYRARLHNANAVSDTDIDVYARSYAAPGGLRAGFELYRDFPNDEQQFAQFQRTKLRMPVLAMGGEADNGSMIEQMARELASDVSGAIVP